MKRKDALIMFKKIMDGAGIKFWLGYGSCLGAYRDGELIDTDHDIDIEIFDSSIQEVEKVLFYPYNSRSGKPDQFTFIIEGYKFDVCFWQKVGDEYHLRIRGGKPDKIPAKFGELTTIEFYGEEFLIPKLTEEYLEYYYEKDWNIKNPNKKAITRR